MSAPESPRTLPLVVQDVSKTFRIPRENVHTLKERALHPFRRTEHDVLKALRSVSFEVQPGEFFGVVGRNGSGKSTLLKCVAGIYATDVGGIYVDGRVASFIELGVGFNPDLPARDNVTINGTMLGLSPRQARARFDDIIEFAELEDFIDLKLKNYSSGMMVRLAFATMIFVDADLLLIDEVLAVGDAAFQRKCYDEFDKIAASGKTVMFVSHDMNAVQRFCDRVVLLENGVVQLVGDAEQVASRYLELNFSDEAREAAALNDAEVAAEDDAEHEPEPTGVAVVEPVVPYGTGVAPLAGERAGDGGAEWIDAWVENAAGERVHGVTAGDECAVCGRVRFDEDVEDPIFAVGVQNGRRWLLLQGSTLYTDPHPGTFRAGEEVDFRARFVNRLGPDDFTLTLSVERSDGGWLDHRQRAIAFVVTSPQPGGGLIDPDFDFDVTRHAAPVKERS